MAHQSYSLTLDGASKLTDATAFTSTAAGSVSGGDGYVNFGSATAFAKFAVVIDWTTCVVNDGNELYTVVIEGATESGFSTAYRLVDYAFGDTSVTGHPVDTSPSGRKVIYGDNVVITSASDGNSVATMQYLRIKVFVAGTTPSMNLAAWLVPMP